MVAERILCRHPFNESKRAYVVPQCVEELLKCFWPGSPGMVICLSFIQKYLVKKLDLTSEAEGSGKQLSNQQHSLDFKSGLVPGQIRSATARVVIYKSECFQRIAANPHGAFLEYTKRIQCGNSNTTTGRTKDIYMHEQWWIGHLGLH
ncbi:hypothetical protein ACSBR2_020208 [Camellia fascicularis]